MDRLTMLAIKFKLFHEFGETKVFLWPVKISLRLFI